MKKKQYIPNKKNNFFISRTKKNICTLFTTKMNIAIISDVHLETWDKGKADSPSKIYASTNCDTLVIAGDFGYPFNTRGKCNRRFVNVLKKLKTIYEYIVYVPGNHEYYNINT